MLVFPALDVPLSRTTFPWSIATCLLIGLKLAPGIRTPPARPPSGPSAGTLDQPIKLAQGEYCRQRAVDSRERLSAALLAIDDAQGVTDDQPERPHILHRGDDLASAG